MCFDPHYDWRAEVCDETVITCEKTVQCDECNREIQPGQNAHHVFMQEHEECHRCDMGECECPTVTTGPWAGEPDCCKCEKPEYGETFDYSRCEDCNRFLDAVQQAEEDAGCGGNEARPALGEMINAICDGGAHEAKRYWKKAVQLHPGLKASGYLAFLWKRMFA